MKDKGVCCKCNASVDLQPGQSTETLCLGCYQDWCRTPNADRPAWMVLQSRVLDLLSETHGVPISLDFAALSELVLVEVCKHTTMTPERWNAISPMQEESRIPYLQQTIAALESPNAQTCTADDVPKEFREGGKSGGEILTSTYLVKSTMWHFKNHKQFTDAFNGEKLTERIKVGRAYAYLYLELCGLRAADANKDGA